MKVLVLGAGGPAGVNTCKALSSHEVVAMDENPDHLVWCEPHAEQVVCGPAEVELVNLVEADVVIPCPDNLTLWLADHADQIRAKTFLPDRRTIVLCQDKFEAGLAWRRAGLRTDRIELDPHTADLEFPCWLRARHGAGAKAAVKPWDTVNAHHWMSFWRQREPGIEFVAEKYLSGRDLAWSSIWYQGDLVCSFTRERLEYIYPGLTPEGLTGTPTIAEIVHDDAVNAMAEAAVHAVDEEPHGLFSVDLREDAGRIPRPTEINAGRGFTTFGLWCTQTDPSLLEKVVEWMVDPGWTFETRRDILPAGLRLYRHIDCGATFTSKVLA